jgi:hypothetical protein
MMGVGSCVQCMIVLSVENFKVLTCRVGAWMGAHPARQGHRGSRCRTHAQITQRIIVDILGAARSLQRRRGDPQVPK